MATGLLRGAGSIRAASWAARRTAPRVARGGRRSGPRQALQNAVEEIQPAVRPVQEVRQLGMPRRLLERRARTMQQCAPIAQREISSLQAQITVEQAGEKLRQQDLTSGLNLASTAVVICPSCGVENEGGKFCQECGGLCSPKPNARAVAPSTRPAPSSARSVAPRPADDR